MRLGWQYLQASDKEALFNGLISGKPPYPGPFHLEIDPFDACNAQCYFCSSKAIRHGAILPWDRLHLLLEAAHAGGLRSIRLAGGGEPLLYPHFIDLLHWSTQHDVRLDNLTTNGLRLSGALAEALAQSPPLFLNVSLNYATAAGYSQGMGLDPSRFDEVCGNVLQFGQLLRRAHRERDCQIHIQFMLNRDTLNQLPLMFELASRLQVHGLTIRGIQNLPQAERLRPEERRRFINDVTPLAHHYTDTYWIMFDLGCEGLAAEAAELTAAIHAHHGLEVSPDPLLDLFRFCLMPWYSLAVLGSGNVYPCCMLLNDTTIKSLGNLKTQTLDEIWNGPAYQQMRWEVRRSMILGGGYNGSSVVPVHVATMLASGGLRLGRQPARPRRPGSVGQSHHPATFQRERPIHNFSISHVTKSSESGAAHSSPDRRQALNVS